MMNTREQLADMLERSDGEYLSGNEIAGKLGITRAAVWKCIRQLQDAGYEIEAVRNRGYRLGGQHDVVSVNSICRYLTFPVPIEVRQSVTSTNDVLKRRAQELPDWYTLVSVEQTKGKGRRGRVFYSPADTGLYLSMLVRLDVPPEEATRITTVAAVAACRAIAGCTERKPGIKWVNDVFAGDRKVCGILTEATVSMETGSLDWAVMGIGFNVYEPAGGFPPELQGIAGSICTERRKDLRSRIAASFIQHFTLMCRNLTDPAIVQEYRERSIMQNRKINVIRNGEPDIPAVVEEIDDSCRLVVRLEDGTQKTLSSGEVSIRI